jgi:peptidoglycan/xylan/chitin deacetylase (PgdA/CDA1 family)
LVHSSAIYSIRRPATPPYAFTQIAIDYDPSVVASLVLCYHGVSTRWPEGISPTRLRAHVEHLLARGYRPVLFSDAVRARHRRVFSVTFDDGYRSVVEHAFPVLDEVGVKATVFVPTDYIGGATAAWPGTDKWLDSSFADELSPMSWDELRLLAEHGWEVGSHSRSHARLVQLADADLNEEMAGSRAVLEHQLARQCTALAYPYGEADDRVIAAAAAAGYRAACTLTTRFESPRPLAWPRVGAYEHDRPVAFRTKVSPTVRRLRATRAWDVLRPERWRGPHPNG